MGDHVVNAFLICLLIGISLSMDAFSLALVYGMYGLTRKDEFLLSLIVGLFHFFMPIIGLFFGNMIFHYIVVDSNLIVGIIFGLIGGEMFWSSFREQERKILIGFVPFLLFGFSVSIDGLTTGIGMSSISNNYLMISSIFMLLSSIFTYLGLKIGSYFSDRFGKLATIVGSIVMITLGGCYIF